MQHGREGCGRYPDAQGFQTIFLLLPSQERLFQVESGHAAGRGGVGKLSSCPGTPNFVPISSFSRENNPGLVWSRSREGRRGEVLPTLRDSKLCSLLLLSHEKKTLVESGHAAGKGRRGEVVLRSRDSKLCSLLLPSHERITLVESGHAAGKGGVRELSRRPGTSNYFPASSFSRESNPG